MGHTIQDPPRVQKTDTLLNFTNLYLNLVTCLKSDLFPACFQVTMNIHFYIFTLILYVTLSQFCLHLLIFVTFITYVKSSDYRST